jgi:hypothetical protein
MRRAQRKCGDTPRLIGGAISAAIDALPPDQHLEVASFDAAGAVLTLTVGEGGATFSVDLSSLRAADLVTADTLQGDGTAADPLGVRSSTDPGNGLMRGTDGGLFAIHGGYAGAFSISKLATVLTPEQAGRVIWVSAAGGDADITLPKASFVRPGTPITFVLHTGAKISAAAGTGPDNLWVQGGWRTSVSVPASTSVTFVRGDDSTFWALTSMSPAPFAYASGTTRAGGSPGSVIGLDGQVRGGMQVINNRISTLVRGWYRVSARWRTFAANTSIEMRKNGGGWLVPATAVDSGSILVLNEVVNLFPGDYVDFRLVTGKGSDDYWESIFQVTREFIEI